MEKTYDVSGFNRVAIATGGSMQIETGDTESLRIEGEDNIIEHLDVTVKGGKLRIRFEKNGSYRTTKPLRMYVTVKSLEGIEIAGSCDVKADRLAGETLDVAVAGSGTVVVGDVSGDRLNIDIAGSGDVEVMNGSVRKQRIEISGSGDYDGTRLTTEDSIVSIAGSGDARVHATEVLDVSVSGSGSVAYVGEPAELSTSVAGSGSIRSLNR